MNKLPNLYIDLDGVMADFDGAFAPTFGADHTTMEDQKMWDYIYAHGSYFRNLPVMKGALEFFNSVRKYQPMILTACPKERFTDVATQKRDWVHEHIGNDVQILLSPGGSTKALYMRQPGDVLVDDFEKNTKRWNAAGGVGIRHVDWDTTKAAMTKLGFEL